MKRNILTGVVLAAALAFASCSTQKLASNQTADDDVYNTKAKAGDQVEAPISYRQDMTGNGYGNGYSDDDYYYYDSYASRINRFSYGSPFNYYDDYYYYDYTAPTYSVGVNNYAYGNYGWGLGLGLGFGYGYGSPYFGVGYGYGYPYYGYGYGSYYGYSPYSVWGVGYGGGYPYWGVYSAYGSARGGIARPYRGSGAPGALTNRSTRPIGYGGAYPNTNYYPGRGNNAYSGGRGTNSYGGNQNARPTRPVRTDYPNYQPPQRSTNSFPSNGGNSGGGSSNSGGGGGGARPVRP